MLVTCMIDEFDATDDIILAWSARVDENVDAEQPT